MVLGCAQTWAHARPARTRWRQWLWTRCGDGCGRTATTPTSLCRCTSEMSVCLHSSWCSSISRCKFGIAEADWRCACRALQMVVEDEQVVATVHITPMRASRALALRYLATKFGADMENIVVRTCTVLLCREDPLAPGEIDTCQQTCRQWSGNSCSVRSR